MKNYIAKAEMCTYLQVTVRASSQEEAERLASEMCGSAFTEIKGCGSWEIYNVEEAEL